MNTGYEIGHSLSGAMLANHKERELLARKLHEASRYFDQANLRLRTCQDPRDPQFLEDFANGSACFSLCRMLVGFPI
jgi:hypothetical protein